MREVKRRMVNEKTDEVLKGKILAMYTSLENSLKVFSADMLEKLKAEMSELSTLVSAKKESKALEALETIEKMIPEGIKKAGKLTFEISKENGQPMVVLHKYMAKTRAGEKQFAILCSILSRNFGIEYQETNIFM